MASEVVEPSVQSLIIDGLNRVETKVDAGFAAVATKLETKADKSDIGEIRVEIRTHHERISKLEQTDRAREVITQTERKTRDEENAKSQADRDKRQNRKTFVLGVLTFLAMTLAIVLPLIHV